MAEDINNYLPTVMFCGTPCKAAISIKKNAYSKPCLIFKTNPMLVTREVQW